MIEKNRKILYKSIVIINEPSIENNMQKWVEISWISIDDFFLPKIEIESKFNSNRFSVCQLECVKIPIHVCMFCVFKTRDFLYYNGQEKYLRLYIYNSGENWSKRTLLNNFHQLQFATTKNLISNWFNKMKPKIPVFIELQAVFVFFFFVSK